MRLGDRVANGFRDLRGIEPAQAMAIHLLHDHEPLLAVDLDGERGAPPARSAGWLPLDGPLDVLRVVVAPADDDQVLEPPGDEQLARRRGSRDRRCAGTGRRRRERGAERPLRLLGPPQ